MAESVHGTGGWKGLLAEEEPRTRLIAFFAMLLLASSMTFIQFGFVGVGTQGAYLCHAIGLLGPVAVTALLLGKGWGALGGALAGAVLWVHANRQPLDLIEYYFVTFLNSMVLLSFTGFLCGLLFARALRKYDHGRRRALRLGISCFVVAYIATLLFTVNAVVVEVIGHYTEALGGRMQAFVALNSMGDGFAQTFFNFLLTYILALFTDGVVRQYKRSEGRTSIRATFHMRLLAAILMTFLVVSSVCFAIITHRCVSIAEDDMWLEVVYLAHQMELNGELSDQVPAIPEFEELSDSSQDFILSMTSNEHLLEGYTLTDDGTVVIFEEDGTVLLTNSPAFPQGSTISTLMGDDGMYTLEKAVLDGESHHMVYAEEPLSDLLYSEEASSKVEMGFMCATKTRGHYVMMERPASMVFAERSSTMVWTTLMVLALLIAIYVIVTRLLTRVVAQPIDETNASLARITQGDLNEVVEVRDSIEFSSLSDGINETVHALKGWIDEAHRRMERELTTAKAIQESALPRVFPPFPEIDAFDIYARMDAAREVGGDFYDFFHVDERTLGFLIADVSGKGIPAALFMMEAKAELQNYMVTGMDLAQAVARTNRVLCANNDADMFVTVWAATLDYETGDLTYVNAGHNPPLLRRGRGGTWEWVTTKCGLFLGTFETARYRTATLTLEPGDELLLYTDGVNEAFGVHDEEYGNDRLEAFLTGHSDQRPRELTEELRADVASWAEGAEQSDDVTILVLEFGVPHSAA